MTTAPTDILKQLDDPEPGSTWFWSLASIVAFVVIIVAASAFYFKIDSFEEDAKVIDQPTLSLEQLRATQREELAVYSTPGPCLMEQPQPSRAFQLIAPWKCSCKTPRTRRKHCPPTASQLRHQLRHQPQLPPQLPPRNLERLNEFAPSHTACLSHRGGGVGRIGLRSTAARSTRVSGASANHRRSQGT